MSAAEFDAYFDRFEVSTFRLETLQHYDVDEGDEDFLAFREGRRQSERSVRTSPWLARMAVTTIAGKRWSRVHVVDHPLTEYLRYEVAAYVQSAVVGERISIADRADHPDLGGLGPDFWLFDAETDNAYAVLMHYDPDGRWLGFDYADDNATLQRCRAQRDLGLAHSTGLNAYLAGAARMLR